MGLGSQGRDTKSKVNVAKGNAYECSSWSLAGGKGAHYQIKLASSFYAQHSDSTFFHEKGKEKKKNEHF